MRQINVKLSDVDAKRLDAIVEEYISVSDAVRDMIREKYLQLKNRLPDTPPTQEAVADA